MQIKIINQSPVLRGHIFLVLSYNISYEFNLFKRSPVLTGYWTRAIKRFALFDLLKSIFRYQDLVEKYSVSAETITNDGFS
jgi:hypothetical protein